MTRQDFIVVFDMDETLGHFSQLHVFWSILRDFFDYIDYKYVAEDFYQLIETFNLFLRPEIMTILKYLIEAKRAKRCDKIMIYTNNNGPKSWAESIRDYFHWRLDYQIFDQIIGAFKVGGRQIEMCRTGHYKSVSDLISCTKLPENTKILFIDDQHHPEMEGNNVVYLHIKPYIYNYRFIDMINSYYTANAEKIDKLSDRSHYYNFFKERLGRYRDAGKSHSSLDAEIDAILSRKIIEHLTEFFKTRRTQQHTKKRRRYRLNNTKRR